MSLFEVLRIVALLIGAVGIGAGLAVLILTALWKSDRAETRGRIMRRFEERN